MLRQITTVVSLIALSGCAVAVQHPKSIAPMSISPTEYDGMPCAELNDEQLSIWKRKEDLRIPLKHAAEDFALLAGTREYSEIKHEYSEKLGRLKALEMAAYKHDCKVRTSDELKAEYGLEGKVRASWPSRN